MGKLVRDGIPDLIRARGAEPATRVLDGAEFDAALRDKLVEEALEVRSATGPADVLAEAADVYEVLIAVAEHLGVSLETIAEAARQKRAERGAFGERIWLESP